MRKTTKLNTNLISGIVLCIIGLVIGRLYFQTSYPYNHFSGNVSGLMAAWAVTGLWIAGLFLFWGLCKIVLDWYVRNYR